MYSIMYGWDEFTDVTLARPRYDVIAPAWILTCPSLGHCSRRGLDIIIFFYCIVSLLSVTTSSINTILTQLVPCHCTQQSPSHSIRPSHTQSGLDAITLWQGWISTIRSHPLTPIQSAQPERIRASKVLMLVLIDLHTLENLAT